MGRARGTAARRHPAHTLAILATWREWAFGSGGFGLNPYSGTWFDTVLYSARRVVQGFFWAVVVGVPMAS